MFIDTQLRPQGEVQVDEVGRVLLAAADLLERDGWCQGRLNNWKGQRCMVEAISEITPVASEACKRLYKLIGPSIICWNDAPGRTPPRSPRSPTWSG